jgi:tetrahydromethanopterin S-methyltransferase subunit B
MLLKKTEGWENVMYGPDVDTMIKEALNPIKEQIKALEEAVKELKLKHIGITDVRELEEKVDKLDENRRFQWQLNKDQIEVLNERTQPLIKHNVKSNLVFQLPDDDEIFEQTAKEEYDYHKESKYWDKRAKQAYEDHMSEPDEEDNSLIW